MKIPRRNFIGLIGGAAALPFAARAQQLAMPIVGFLNGGSPERFASMTNAFRQGLRESGFVEDQNVAIEYRWAHDQFDRLAALADDLVRRRVSVIVANTPANLVAKAATATVPIVFTTGADPVQLGLVSSLDRPGGNVTGVTTLSAELAPKRLELLHELVPTASVIALLINPTDAAQAEPITRASQAAARGLGLDLQVLNAVAESEFEGIFAKLSQLRAGGLVISAGTFFVNHSEQLAALALRHMMPAIFEFRPFVAAGGLAGYGGSITESYHLAGVYAGRILKGEKPADLPVQQSTKVEFFINLKTAKSLGLTIPLPLLGRADEVIE
jgi:putative ABC transport system substrate-binding protein